MQDVLVHTRVHALHAPVAVLDPGTLVIVFCMKLLNLTYYSAMKIVHDRSYSPAPRRRDDYSASPPRSKEEHRRSSKQPKENNGDKKRRSYTPEDRNDRRGADNGLDE